MVPSKLPLFLHKLQQHLSKLELNQRRQCAAGLHRCYITRHHCRCDAPHMPNQVLAQRLLLSHISSVHPIQCNPHPHGYNIVIKPTSWLPIYRKSKLTGTFALVTAPGQSVARKINWVICATLAFTRTKWQRPCWQMKPPGRGEYC